MFGKMAQINLNKTPGKSILKTPGTGKKSVPENKSVRILFNNDEEPISDSELTSENIQNSDKNEILSNSKEKCSNRTIQFSENKLSPHEPLKTRKTKTGLNSKSKKNSISPINLSEERVLKIPKLQIEPLKGWSTNNNGF